ncbi:MAG: amidohydrolase family protein [Candidatus Jordarchaeum sp.]|uniref:amidohydrolase family protein n=1 Tax=Candidatus Jordarchaeum sp. TaxID=2823881 RepID=UPI00404B6B0A
MIVDVHCHLSHRDFYPDIYWNLLAQSLSKNLDIPSEQVLRNIMPDFWQKDASKLVENMDNAGVDKAVIMPVDFELKVGKAKMTIEEQNLYHARAADEYPDKLISFVGVDPRRGEKALELFEKGVTEWGMKGLKFHPDAGYYANDPLCFPLYEKCVEYDVPLLCHCGLIFLPFEVKYNNPIYLDDVQTTFPELKIIAAHIGGISGTLTLAEIGSLKSGISTEISYTGQMLARGTPRFLLNNLRMLMDLPLTFAVPFKNRILFGSDWPYANAMMELKEWVNWIKKLPEKGKEYGLKFTEEEVRLILGENAKKILKI